MSTIFTDLEWEGLVFSFLVVLFFHNTCEQEALSKKNMPKGAGSLEYFWEYDCNNSSRMGYGHQITELLILAASVITMLEFLSQVTVVSLPISFSDGLLICNKYNIIHSLHCPWPWSLATERNLHWARHFLRCVGLDDWFYKKYTLCLMEVMWEIEF